MISAIVFDYGGVLMRTADPVPRRELDQRFGLPPGGASKLVFESPLWDEAQLGRISGSEFWADVGQRLELYGEELVRFRRAFWAGDRLDEDLIALIRHLREAGYRTALLSNAPAGLRQHIDELGIADAFDEVVISGYEELMKPDPALFGRMLTRLGMSAEQVVFVDDTRANVAAAQRIGFHAIRFLGLAPLRRWLRDLDVPVPDPVLMPLSDVQAVIFDWGGVMEALPDDAHIFEWERRLALAPGMLSEVLWGELWRRFSSGASTRDEYVQSIGEHLGFPDADTADHFLEEFYTDDRFYPEVAAAAHALRGRYKVALLSNATPDQDVWIRERFGIDVYADFDAYINSAHVGLRKPDPAIFRRMLNQLGVAPQQAILLDDGLRNVDSARELGIHVVQFVHPDTSLGELEALLGHSIG